MKLLDLVTQLEQLGLVDQDPVVAIDQNSGIIYTIQNVVYENPEDATGGTIFIQVEES